MDKNKRKFASVLDQYSNIKLPEEYQKFFLQENSTFKESNEDKSHKPKKSILTVEEHLKILNAILAPEEEKKSPTNTLGSG